jgi:AcrR family transcriptional regulator
LAAERPATSIAATEVTAAAGVHRSTFYEHASSVPDLLEQALLAELDDLRDRLLADESDVAVAVTQVTRNVLDHVARHAGVYRRGLLSDEPAGSLHPMLSRHFRESSRLLQDRARVDIGITVPGLDQDRVADAASRFLADGTVGVIASWLAHDPLDVEIFMRLYLRLVPDWWPRDLTAG